MEEWQALEPARARDSLEPGPSEETAFEQRCFCFLKFFFIWKSHLKNRRTKRHFRISPIAKIALTRQHRTGGSQFPSGVFDPHRSAVVVLLESRPGNQRGPRRPPRPGPRLISAIWHSIARGEAAANGNSATSTPPSQHAHRPPEIPVTGRWRAKRLSRAGSPQSSSPHRRQVVPGPRLPAARLPVRAPSRPRCAAQPGARSPR